MLCVHHKFKWYYSQVTAQFFKDYLTKYKYCKTEQDKLQISFEIREKPWRKVKNSFWLQKFKMDSSCLLFFETFLYSNCEIWNVEQISLNDRINILSSTWRSLELMWLCCFPVFWPLEKSCVDALVEKIEWMRWLDLINRIIPVVWRYLIRHMKTRCMAFAYCRFFSTDVGFIDFTFFYIDLGYLADWWFRLKCVS